MNVARLIFLCTVLTSPLAGQAATPPAATAANDATLRELGRQWLEDAAGVGLSIGIYHNGQRRFLNFGTTRIDGNSPPTKDTVYEIGPLAKTMTGQLLARAVVEGRASLDDEATKYLPEPYPNLANSGENIRLVHLANMTSQLLDNIPDITQVRLSPTEPLAASRMRVVTNYTREEFLRQLHRVVPRRAPGIEPGPSNVSSMLLAVVLEAIYGDSFESIIATQIEKPLRMKSGTQPAAKLLARGYGRENEELPTFAAPMAHSWGSLRYSADDLLRYASWQLVERDASVKLAHQPTWLTPDKQQGVALFWITSESPHGRRLHFSGATFGFVGVCELYPDAGVAVVLLANKDTDGAQESLRALSAKIVGTLKSP
jgi:CubicO group peptidase (beta-lactamase class C family)